MPHRLSLFLFACDLALGLLLPVQMGQAQSQRPSNGPDALFRFERFSTVEGLTGLIMGKERCFKMLWIGVLEIVPRSTLFICQSAPAPWSPVLAFTFITTNVTSSSCARPFIQVDADALKCSMISSGDWCATSAKIDTARS